MKIIAETLGGRQLLLDVGNGLGRVLDTRQATLEDEQPLPALQAEDGWIPYRGPQNVRVRLRDTDEVPARTREFLTGTAVEMTRGAERMLPR